MKAVLERLPGIKRYWIAFSGGVDSTALLHLVSANRQQLDAEVLAVHVDHQISKNSGAWSRHCENICKEFDIPLKQIRVDAGNYHGSGPEAHARELRYGAIRKLIQKNEVLLTAHHQDDLAETFILQLMRGAGPEGLAGMPLIRKFGVGWLVRPLLCYSRKQLEAYAIENRLNWIEDESNLNLKIDRNYVRNNILGFLEERWPAARKTIARSAGLQADVIEILNDIGRIDYERTQAGSADMLNLDEFIKLSDIRKKNLLRYWLKYNNHSLPGADTINRIISEVVNAREDSTPLITWQDTEVRRYRNRLFVMEPSKAIVDDKSYTWNLERPLELEWGRLHASLTTGAGIRATDIIDNIIIVRFRCGGETIHPAGRHETHKLKKLFQEKGIPPWQRSKIPLLFIGDQLAAVTGYWIDEKFIAGKSEQGWNISISET